MQTNGNTILITGGGSGIGLALALALKEAGNEVIVAGRSKEKLASAESMGLRTASVDMTSEPSMHAMAKYLLEEFPALNVVIHNAGIMVNEKLTSRDNSAAAKDTILTNLLGPIVLTNALLPHFLKQKSATIITVSSGLAFVPLVMTPTYSATKAAIHSYSQSLRYQLKDTAVKVKELIPPYVQTGLMGERQKEDPYAMPLKEFIAEVMSILKDDPNGFEIAVKRVEPQRTAGFDRAAYEAFFEKQTGFLMTARKKEWDSL